ncbi:MAG TPA: sulfotransferase [Tepidisphaeraceae bacterium]|nr:sulfotransferase [Tepidisphaeraceae bacterium]
MSLQSAAQPVILLGMHRSGTAMIARLLDELGLFQGAELQEDHESVWFLELNDILLKRVNATWDNPAPIRGFLENPEAFDLTSRCLADDLSSKRTREFLGKKWSNKTGQLLGYKKPWGWKDPRTVFTLPLWLTLFPAAKLVCIVRNGVDVASSLKVREVKELQRRREEFDEKKSSGDRFRIQRAGFKGSARCLTLAGGFSLWEEYVEEAERILGKVSNSKHFIRYESFLADPAKPLTELAAFCGVDSDEAAVQRAIADVGVNATRANAYAKDPAVAEFHSKVRASRWMTHYGYDA